MDNPSPIYYRDLITPDSSITDLIAQLDALIQKYEAAKGKIQGAAADTAKSISALSGATEEQRKSIALSTEASEKLLAQYRAVDNELMQTKRAQAEVNAVNREYTQIAKLLTELNSAKEGSYKQLSAQYRLNKIALNEMSEAERKGTEYGRKLEAETKAMYERMNDLQKATGKAQLQVGQYERALGGVLGVNQNLVRVLTDTGEAQKTFNGVMAAIKSPVGIAIGAIGGLTAAYKLFKASLQETQQTGDALDQAVAGWTASWEVFKKSIATVNFRSFIDGAREAMEAGRSLKAVLDETFERTSSTRILRASMSAENAALEEAMRNTKLSYEERLAAADKYLANMQPIYEQETETARRNRDAQLEYLFAVTNRTKFESTEAREAAKKAFADNIKNYNLNEDLIKQAKQYNEALGNLTAREKGYAQNISAEVLRANKALVDSASDEVKAFSAFARQYNLTKDAEVQAYVDAEVKYQESLSAAYQSQKRIVTMRNNLEAQQEAEAKRAGEARVKAAQDAAKAEAKAAEDAAKAEQKAAEDAAKAEAQAAKEREEARRAEIAEQRAVLNASLQSTQLQIAITQEGTDEMLALRLEMIEKQRQIELFENQQKAEKLRMDEKAINAKYDQMQLREQADFNTKLAQRDLAASQDLAQAEFDLLDKNERQKTLFRLQQEKARLEAVLKINETATNKMTADEIAAIKATIAGIEKETKRLGFNNIYELLGISLDSDQQDAIKTAVDSVKDNIESLADSWNQAAEAATKAADAQVEAAQRTLDAEIEARNAGYANEVATAQKEMALAKKNQEQALKEQEKAQKAQLAVDALTQSSSLITASANIWKSLSGIPVVGPGLAAAALATMWVSFAAAKIRAVQVTKQEKYGDGTVELLEGGSHASGHDIDLGTKRDGTRRRAEGGEFFAVINKRNSRRYRNVIPDVINSFNNGTFADRYQRANASMSGYAVQMLGAGGTDVSGLERDVAAIRQQGDENRYVDGQGNTIIRYKNLTRKIKS